MDQGGIECAVDVACLAFVIWIMGGGDDAEFFQR